MWKRVLGALSLLLLTAVNPVYPADVYVRYPPNALPLDAASVDTAAGAISISFPAVAGWVNYVAGYRCDGTGATAASVVLVVLGGLIGPAMGIPVAVPAGVGIQDLSVQGAFDPPIPSLAPNTAIILQMPSLGAGSLHATCSMWGFRVPAGT